MFIRFAVIVTFLIFSRGANAWPGRPPEFGIIANEKLHDFMQFRCDPPTAQGITCKFQEVGVHRKGGPDALAKSLAEVPEAVKVGVPPDMKNICKNATALADGLRSGKQPANLPDSRHAFDEWAAAGPRAKSDLQNFWGGWAKLCAAPTAENWEALMRQQNDKDSRTCSISVNSFEQTFTQQDADVWVHTGEPGGICGVIAIATFEREPGSGALWNYRTREVVTNKNALKDNELFNCHKIDEAEQLFTWKNNQSIYMGCDYLGW